MELSWYLGFGWISIILCLTFGAASYFYSVGWLHWVLYAAFVIVAAYMLTKFRLHYRDPWRRVHQRAMPIFRKLLKQADGNLELSCRLLLEKLTDKAGTEQILKAGILTEEGRKRYYHELAETFSGVFASQVKPEHRKIAIQNVHKDIDTSQWGPDIIIAAVIERKYGRLEAARYLLALETGIARLVY